MKIEPTPSSREATQASPLIVIGAGGHAGVLVEALSLSKREVLFATEVDASAVGSRLGSVEVRGHDDLVLSLRPDEVELVNGIGSAGLPLRRRDVFARFKAKGYTFASVIHPRAIVARTASLGEGVQIMAGAVVQTHAVLGDDTLVNTGATVDHGCSVGEHTHVAPGVTLCGDVRVGAGSHIGAGTTIIQGVTLGEEVLVGAGSLVLKDFGDHETIWGVPAQRRRRDGGG